MSRTELNALKQQQEELSDKKTDIQKQADAIKGKVNAQTEKLNLLTAQLDVTNSQLKNLSAQIAVYVNTTAELENSLNLEQQRELELQSKYRTRMRIMEENGSIAYISVLFQANSFSDLISLIESIRSIMEYDNGLIRDVRDAKVKTQTAKTDLEAEIANQQKVFAAYQAKKSDLAAQQAEINTVLSSLSATSADYDKQLQTVKALQSTISSQITDMANKLAEQERIQAEQAAAAKAAAAKAAAAKASGGKNWYGDASGSGTGTGQDIIKFAESFLGVPYVYGGEDPSGFDCSGLVWYCYKHFGYSINRTATAQSYNGRVVSSSELKAGDLVFFTEQDSIYIGHIGLYVGNGEFIHAPHTGDVVKISSLSQSYYQAHYWGARRIID